MSLPNSAFASSLQDALVSMFSRSLSVLFIGTFFLFIVHTWTEYQTYRYFKLYGSDLPFSRRIVLAILTTETLIVGLCVLGECQHDGQTHPAIIPLDQWIINAFTPFTVIALFTCQRIYSHCVHLISLRHRVFVAVGVLLVLAGLGLSVATITERHLAGTMDSQDIDRHLYSSFGCTLFLGLGLTGAVVATLLCGRQGLQCAHSQAEILTVYSLNTGLLTSTFALVALLFAIVRPEHLAILGVVVMCVKMITSARLAVNLHLYHLQIHPRRSAPQAHSSTQGNTAMTRSIHRSAAHSGNILLTRNAVTAGDGLTLPISPREERKGPLIGV